MSLPIIAYDGTTEMMKIGHILASASNNSPVITEVEHLEVEAIEVRKF